MLWVGATWSLVLWDYRALGEWEAGGAAGFGRVLMGLLFPMRTVWEAVPGCSQVAEATFSGSCCLQGSFLLQGSGGTDKCESAHLPGVSDVLGSRSAG